MRAVGGVGQGCARLAAREGRPQRWRAEWDLACSAYVAAPMQRQARDSESDDTPPRAYHTSAEITGDILNIIRRDGMRTPPEMACATRPRWHVQSVGGMASRSTPGGTRCRRPSSRQRACTSHMRGSAARTPSVRPRISTRTDQHVVKSTYARPRPIACSCRLSVTMT